MTTNPTSLSNTVIHPTPELRRKRGTELLNMAYDHADLHHWQEAGEVLCVASREGFDTRKAYDALRKNADSIGGSEAQAKLLRGYCKGPQS